MAAFGTFECRDEAVAKMPVRMRLIGGVVVLDKRHVHPRLRRAIRSSTVWCGGYGVVGGCDEERGRGGEE